MKPDIPRRPPREKIYAETKRTLMLWMVSDVEKAFEGKAYVGAAILGLCAIDAMGGFCAEKTDEKPITCTGNTFKKFVNDYMGEKYRNLGGKMYGELRCSLAHGYSTKYFLLDDHHPSHHLRECLWNGKKKMGFNVDTFIKDLRVAVRNYRRAIRNDDEICRRYMIQVRAKGILRPIPDEDVQWL